MDVSHSTDIGAPAEKVFDLITDDEKKKLWAHGLLETLYPEGRSREQPVGTRFIQKINEGGRVAEYQGEILAFERPHKLAFKMSNKHFDMLMTFVLRPVGRKTRVNFSVEMAQTGFIGRTLGSVLGWFTGMIVKRQLASLKGLAERDQ